MCMKDIALMTQSTCCRFTTCLLCRFLLDLRGIHVADWGEEDSEATLQFAHMHFGTFIIRTSLPVSAEWEDDLKNHDDSTVDTCDQSHIPQGSISISSPTH